MRSRTKDWFVTPLVDLEEHRSSLSPPGKVEFYDLSLRDGLEYPGIFLEGEEKLKVVLALDDLGVDRIEAGMPARSSQEAEFVKDAIDAGTNAKIFALCRTREEDIDLAIKCGVSNVLVEAPSSDQLITVGYKSTREKILSESVDALGFAKSRGLFTSFFLMDATRADLSFLLEMVEKAVNEVGVDEVIVVDSVGSCYPEAMAFLTKKVRALGATTGVHCHNDLGLATANALSAVGAGAQVVHVSLNGIAGRSGFTPLDEIALCLKLFLSVDSGIQFNNIYRTSKLFAELTNIPIPPIKPVIGENATVFEIGSALMINDEFLRAGISTGFFPYSPSFIGREYSIRLGTKSNSYAVEQVLKSFGIRASEENVKLILERVIKIAKDKRALLSEAEFERIINEVLQHG